MTRRSLLAFSAFCSLFGWGCSRASFEPALGPALSPPPPPPARSGQLVLRVVYPPSLAGFAAAGETVSRPTEEGFVLQSLDSTFIFGSTGRGDTEVRVNGRPVLVYPNGAWLAWLPVVRRDSVATFDVVASADGQTAHLRLTAPLIQPFEPPIGGAWIDTTSLVPRGDVWVRPGEGVRLSARASPGATVHGMLHDGARIEFVPDTTPDALSWGHLAFGTDNGERPRLARADRYTAWWVGRLGPDPDIVLAPDFPHLPSDTAWMILEVIADRDTAYTRWPLRLGTVAPDKPIVVVVNDDLDGTGETDSIAPGRPSPFGTYHWFFPTGTRAVVSGRINSQVRIQLSQSSGAWVNARDLHPLPPGTPPPGGTTRALRLSPGPSSVVLRVPLPDRVPFRVDERGAELLLRLYGVAADIDWIQYGATDPFVELIEFAQPLEDEVVIRVKLSDPVWGYRTRWEENDLLFEIRRPPTIDGRRPLSGRVIAVDPGHPPGGSTGPTGTKEPEVTLAVAQKVAALLAQYGATGILLRDDPSPVGLVERILAAERSDAELLVSIHANALPDGVNPFVNGGTSVYYFHPRSALLARELNRALVRQFGFTDLGIGRGDLALARPTWMPAALTEGLFMMIPQQEAVLLSDEGQWRYARGVVEGLAAFLRERAIHAN